MINIINKAECCGCTACVVRCPKQCVTMVEDNEGFLYPKVDYDNCIDCGLCEKVCPVINQAEPLQPLNIYAAKNKNEDIRRNSSSGGVFTLLAEKIINQGGVVFGARFNEKWEVVHSYTDTIDGLAAFRGSKYVQSKIGNTYKEAFDFLKSGRYVLFSGTPCQIAGLKRFLGKDYDNLLTVDFICHGVPSPKVWRKYLKAVTNQSAIKSITFRNKDEGWKNYKVVIADSEAGLNELAARNLYIRGFLKDIYLRPSCHSCPSKQHKSGSDITIADYWGIQNVLPDFDDDKGVSLVMVNNDKGKNALNDLDMESIETSYADAIKGNPSVAKSVQIPAYRTEFFDNIDKDMMGTLQKQLYLPFHTKLARFVKMRLRKMGLNKIIKSVIKK